MACLPDFSKKIHPNLNAFVLIIIILFFTSLSCKKNDELGIEISPEYTSVNTFTADTFLISTKTILADSIKTDELSGSSPLGNYVDPIFGQVNSSIFSHIRLESFNGFENNADIVVDSVILYLAIDGYYGNISNQTFKVEELSENLIKDTSYYSNSEIETKNVDLSSGYSTKANPLQPGYYAGQLVNSSILRIPLDISRFALPIIDQSGNSALDGNDGDEEFLSFFKGIKISAENDVNGGLYYIDLISSFSTIKMFYRDTSGSLSEHDTLDFNFNINSNCAFFHNVKHNYHGTIIENTVSQNNSDNNQLFIQSLGGLNSVLTIPSLSSLRDSNVIVNKAEIILPCEYYDYSELPPSSNLFLSRKGPNNNDEFLPDFFDGKLGGEFDTQNNIYTFNITRHVNEVMSGKVPNDTLKIFPSGGGVTANRTVLNGFSSINRNKAKAIITYTKY
tara:strand:+ start:7072 stop:8418 length:1347 start_codon:yes stop_codon:yes gene_type:complete